MKKRALISVSDKTGVVDFAREHVNLGFEINACKNKIHAEIKQYIRRIF